MQRYKHDRKKTTEPRCGGQLCYIGIVTSLPPSKTQALTLALAFLTYMTSRFPQKWLGAEEVRTETSLRHTGRCLEAQRQLKMSDHAPILRYRKQESPDADSVCTAYA